MNTMRANEIFASTEWRERDLFRACVHEVGHAAVAAFCGIAGEVRIISNPNGGVAQKHYVGQFTLLATPTAAERRIIGLGGSVAQCYEADTRVTGSDISDYIVSGTVELSATDAEMAGDFADREVTRCLWIVRRLWYRIVAEATALARSEVVGEPPRRMDWTTFGL